MIRAATIFSLSSAPGKAGVAVVRVSGPSAFAAALAICGTLPEPRRSALRKLKDPRSGLLLDEALVLVFAAGASFTGEGSVEFHVHGGRAVVRAVLDALGAFPGLRVAEPGEFTRRAFENGRLDLSQVEALGDLIDSETEQQRRQALLGFGGELGDRVHQWRELLLEAKAIVAAEVDFSDEGDVSDAVTSGIDSVLERLQRELSRALEGFRHGRIVQEGFRVALVGAPNVGKSTLLNCLARSDIAIVTEHAGTTRDVLEAKLDVGGYAVILQDTAGLRETIDPVERIGIEKTQRAALAADLVLLLSDGSETVEPPLGNRQGRTIRVRTKSDLTQSDNAAADLLVSARTGAGIDSLMQRIKDLLDQSALKEPIVVTRLRHKQCIESAFLAVLSGRDAQKHGIEFVDDALARVDRALLELVGQIHVEDVLGAIFSRFCIGK